MNSPQSFFFGNKFCNPNFSFLILEVHIFLVLSHFGAWCLVLGKRRQSKMDAQGDDGSIFSPVHEKYASYIVLFVPTTSFSFFLSSVHFVSNFRCSFVNAVTCSA
jgi:hypothetical protein